MKKIKLIICITALLSFFTINANAGVTFLPSTSGISSKSHKSKAVTTEQRCRNNGYSYKCGANQNGIDKCPYNGSYFKSCCTKEYKYTRQECIKAGLKPSSQKCGGFHKCL